jgi:hypothetical protein
MIMAKKWENYCVQLDGTLKAGFGRVLGDQLSWNTEKINAYLGKLGQDGWELVSVVTSIGGHGTSDKLLLFLKRETPNS